MSPRPPLGSHSESHNAYIPSSVQAAISRQLQQSAPAHLRQYMNSDKPTYIPQRAQAELTSFMQKSLPAHMQQYSGAFVQQHIVDPTLRGNHAPRETVAQAPAARRGQMDRDSFIPGEQANAQFLNLFQPDAAPGKAAQPMVLKPGETYTGQPVEQNQPVAPTPPPLKEVPVPGHDPLVIAPNQPVSPQQQPSVDHSPYEFIMSPAKPSKRAARMPGNSTLQRVLIAAVGLVLLIIIASVVMSFISRSGNNTAAITPVLQEQTELVRVATAGATVAGTETTQALAYNVQLGVSSANHDLINYMVTNHHKVNAKVLTLKHSASVDTELQNAQTNSTYDSTLTTVLQNDLTSYSQALKVAYQANPGQKGRELLTTEFNAAQLLITQAQQNQATLSTTNP